MSFQDDWQNPEGGYEVVPGPTIKDPTVLGGPTGRDVQTDARKMSEVDAGGKNIADDRDLDDRGWLLDLNVTSLGNEKRRGGWDPLATPSMDPPQANTSGTRGADDIGSVPADGSMP